MVKMIRVLVLSVVASLSLMSCDMMNLYLNPPTQGRVTLTQETETALRSVFGNGFVNEALDNIYWMDSKALNQLAGRTVSGVYYSVTNEIYISSSLKNQTHAINWDENAPVHEIIHFYQHNRLSGNIDSGSQAEDYIIPSDLSSRLNIEAEAVLAQKVIATLTPSGMAYPATYNAYASYMNRFMKTNLSTN